MNKIEKITSRDNRRLVTARKVRDGKTGDNIFIEGKRLAAEALRSDIEIAECFVVEGFRETELVDSSAAKGAAIYELPEKIFLSIADTDQPQGIILIAKRPVSRTGVIESRIKHSVLPIVIFLKEINNPSNLGAVLRTAEAADVAGVIVSQRSADVFSPRALRSAMGASLRLAVWEDADLDEVIAWSRLQGLRSVAADISATVSYSQLDWKSPSLIVFGSEAHGLNERELAAIDQKIHIPMENNVESLNIAVSVGIILYEAKRVNFGSGREQ
ncbi:RNA methyltransferase [soil metagenome]